MISIRSKKGSGRQGIGRLVVRFWKNQDGATAIEYSLIAGLIFTAIIAAVSAIGAPISESFSKVESGFG